MDVCEHLLIIIREDRFRVNEISLVLDYIFITNDLSKILVKHNTMTCL